MYFGIFCYICYILTDLRLTHLKYPSDKELGPTSVAFSLVNTTTKSAKTN